MLRASALLWSHLGILNKRRYDAVREVYGGLEAPVKHIGEEFLRGLGCKEETVREALMRLEQFDAERAEAWLSKNGVRLLTLEDTVYPERLRQSSDPPLFLYAKGDLSCLDAPMIAVVGTRGMTHHGRRLAGHFVPAFVRAGLVTVSGLALGIDAEVARETVAAGGRTVAVLGSGLARLHPASNRTLAKSILDHGGLILSECAPDVPPTIHGFPARNRIIAALGLGTLVLEAPEGSGALITARFALDEGRDVFVAPGSVFEPTFAGGNALIARGEAALALDPARVLQGLGVIAPAEPSIDFTPSSPEEGALWLALTSLPQDSDDLAERAKLAPPVLAAALTMLELQGRAKNVGGAWVKA